MLHLMELRGGSIAGHKHCTCVVASHREAAANLLVSSELLCGCNADHFVGAWSKWQALTTRVPEAETSTHLGVRVCLARWSIRKLASSAGDSSYRLRCGPQLYSCEDNVLLRVLQTAVQLHLHLRLARWSSRKLALSRSFVAAPLQTDHIAGVWSQRQALTTRVPEAETSTHIGVRFCLARWSIRKLASSAGDSSYRLRCGSQPLHLHLRLARWSSRKLALSRSFVAAPLQTTLQVRGRGGKHLPPECPRRQRRARTLSPSTFASHRGAFQAGCITRSLIMATPS